jgi:thiol-disulfide isomerase/thioredoxin
MINRISAILLCFAVTLPGVWAEDATLSWSNGDSLEGTLVSADEKVLTWQSLLFSDPLRIELNYLSAVKFPKTSDAIADVEGFRIQMRNGDVLFGNLKSIGEQTLGFESSRFGAFEIKRDQVLSLHRTSHSAGLIYSGPRGLEGWQPAFRRSTDENNVRRVIRGGALGVPAPANDEAPRSQPSSWQEEPDGSLSTTNPDAALFLPLELPERFEIELELRSRKMLSFVMAVGRDAKAGLRLESWVDVLVAANGTKFAMLQQITPESSTLHLHIFVDYSAKKMAVYNIAGEKLGEVETTGLRGGAGGLMLRNGEWDLAIRRLRISHWDGTEPKIISGESTRVELADGTVHFGTIQQLDSGSGTISLQKDRGSIGLPLEQISSVIVTRADDGEKVERGQTQLIWNDGGFVSGALVSISADAALISTAYAKEPLLCRLQNAVRLGFTPTDSNASQADRLFHAGGSLQGNLVVDGEAETPIRWKPLGGLNASTLRNGGDARFVRGSSVTHFSEKPELFATFPDVIYLNNNDVLPCRVESCTEDTVQLVSPFSEIKSFAKADVRAIELAASGRIHQKGFSSNGWTGVKSTDAEKRSMQGNAELRHPSILTGDTVRFHLKWPKQSYSSLTVSLFGNSSRKDDDTTHVAFSLVQTNLQVLDRPPQQNQMFFRGIGGPGQEGIVRAPEAEADIQIVARDGNLLVSVDGKQVKTIRLNPAGAGSKGLAFNANVISTGRVVINGRVQQNAGDSIELSGFEVDNLAGTSIRQFIQEETRQAALTIPRFRRDNPPTHVLLAPNGDLLRGRLLGITDQDVRFESRLEPLRIDRQRVAAIVWLQPVKEKTDAKAKADPPSGDQTTKPEDSENGFVMDDEHRSAVQAQLADGFSITMTPDRLENGQIKGSSPKLGKCSFPASAIRELYLGNPASRETSAAYERWTAQNAKEPDWDVASADGGNAAGSQMIGKVADDFELPLLDGTRFRLKDHADKIIVLDFWATWCGPCVAALPDYIAATSEFDSSKVIFVAVNQQEASDRIRGFLTERKLSPTVALDRNGEVGQKFQVSGIPHTVILGPGNVVEDVHVGYQQGGGESLQIAIQQLLDGTWKRPSTAPAQQAPPTKPVEPI